MTKVTGETLVPGMIAAPTGIEGQSGTKAAGGELKPYRDKDGKFCSLYVLDEDDVEITFEGLMKTAGYAAKEVGDQLTLDSVTGYVTAWEEVYSNEDVTKVRGTMHKYTMASAGSGSGSGNGT